MGWSHAFWDRALWYSNPYPKSYCARSLVFAHVSFAIIVNHKGTTNTKILKRWWDPATVVVLERVRSSNVQRHTLDLYGPHSFPPRARERGLGITRILGAIPNLFRAGRWAVSSLQKEIPERASKKPNKSLITCEYAPFQ